MAFLAAIPLIGSLLAGSSAAAVGAAGAGAAGIGAAATAATPWLAIASGVTSLAGAGIGAIGAEQTAKAQAGAAKYNEAVALENANVAKQNQQIASQSGQEQAAISSLRTRATVGAERANAAAAGVDVNSGSAVDVRSSARELGELDALTVRSEATKQAYGYTQQAANFKAEGALDEFEAANAETAGSINAASTVLGGVGSAASNFARYQLQGGFGGI